MTCSSKTQSFVGSIIMATKVTNGMLSTKSLQSVKLTLLNLTLALLAVLKNQQLKEYEFLTTDGQVRYLLAPDSEHAAWAAAELSGGSQFVLDVRLSDEW